MPIEDKEEEKVNEEPADEGTGDSDDKNDEDENDEVVAAFFSGFRFHLRLEKDAGEDHLAEKILCRRRTDGVLQS